MLEVLALLMAIHCPAPDLPSSDDVALVVEDGTIPAAITPAQFAEIRGSLPDQPATSDSGLAQITYGVEVDPVYADQLPCFEAVVDSVLSDESGWPLMLKAVPWKTPQIVVRLSAPSSCVTWRHSCAGGSPGRGVANINFYRWHTGAGDIDAYRVFIINHEVGHLLGMGHESCDEGRSVMNPWFSECGAESWPSEYQRAVSIDSRRQ